MYGFRGLLRLLGAKKSRLQVFKIELVWSKLTELPTTGILVYLTSGFSRKPFSVWGCNLLVTYPSFEQRRKAKEEIVGKKKSCCH